jgi:2-aminoadipate transaminase
MESNLTNLFLAKRTKHIRSSLIREILKITVKDSEFLSFAGGLPNPNLIERELLQMATEETLISSAESALQYGESTGVSELKQLILDTFVGMEGCDTNSICITHGSQQGLDILGKLFMDEDTNVLLEDPVYLGALQAFSPYQPKFFSLALEADGPSLSKLREILSSRRIHCFYTNPSYQNPSTITWTVEKRIAVAELLDEYEVILFEDEAYQFLDFSGTVYPSIASFRKNKDLTFVLGSFSKIISPGFRLGWVVVPNVYLEMFTRIKQGNDLNSNQFSQIVLLNLLSRFDFKEHCRKIQSYYHKQKQHLVDCLAKYLPEVRFQNPQGGMFLWVEYPNVSEKEMMQHLMEKKVVMVPGNEFRLLDSDSAYFRMNFSFLQTVDMEEGVKRIASVYRDIIT